MGADQAGRRPSWQTEPCPDWCTRVHQEDDHPDDRIHQDDGVVFPAVIARVDPQDLSREPVATELLVQRSQAVIGDAYVWVFIGETETANRLTVSAESAALLRYSLPG